jgi:hypothetical protein
MSRGKNIEPEHNVEGLCEQVEEERCESGPKLATATVSEYTQLLDTFLLQTSKELKQGLRRETKSEDQTWKQKATRAKRPGAQRNNCLIGKPHHHKENRDNGNPSS